MKFGTIIELEINMTKTHFTIATIFLTLVFSLASWANKCTDLFEKIDVATQATKFPSPVQELDSLLGRKKFSGTTIIDLLSRDPELRKLFEADSGVWEGYSIREHTLMVYEVFLEQLPHFVQKLKNPKGIDIVRLLKFIIAPHDIGKPIAIVNEGKHAQHKYTEPILVDTMEQLSFSKQEIEIAKNLVNNDIFGDLMKGMIDATVAHAKLQALATSASMNIKDYFHLQTFFYTIDAASYPTLRQRVFYEADGKLIPKTPRFQELQNLIDP